MTAMDGVWLVVVTVLMVLLQQYWLSRRINTRNHQRNVVRMSPLLAMLAQLMVGAAVALTVFAV